MTPQEKAELKALAVDWITKKGASDTAIVAENAAELAVKTRMEELGVTNVWSGNRVLRFSGGNLVVEAAEDIT